MYVIEIAHTDGHMTNVTGVDWHPLNHDIAIICSCDGSVRMWNLKWIIKSFISYVAGRRSTGSKVRWESEQRSWLSLLLMEGVSLLMEDVDVDTNKNINTNTFTEPANAMDRIRRGISKRWCLSPRSEIQTSIRRSVRTTATKRSYVAATSNFSY
jgi:WD40 repeat protein